MRPKFEWAIAVFLPLQLTCISYYILAVTSSGINDSGNNTRGKSDGSYFLQWLLFVFLDATYGHLFHILLLIPSRYIASHLPGSVVPSTSLEKAWSDQEEESNDETIIWPSPSALVKLPLHYQVIDRNSSDDDDAIVIRNKENNQKKKSQARPSSDRGAKKNKQKAKRHSDRSSEKDNGTELTSVAAEATCTNELLQSKRTLRERPYYLNHVRGSTRIRQASQRVGAAMGTLAATYLVHSFSSSSASTYVTLEELGLYYDNKCNEHGIESNGCDNRKWMPAADLAKGCLVGSFIVLVIFILELLMDWIRIVGFVETTVTEECFIFNISWDILFHIGVSINEEIMLRGWMFVLAARGVLRGALLWLGDDVIDDNDNSNYDRAKMMTTFAIVTSVLLQSTLFSLLHLHSPGSTSYVSLANLFLGGIAASLNVALSGGKLWFGIGWHFGWNITMGHLLGRSTSGIPMSCSLLNVIPRPRHVSDKQRKDAEKWKGMKDQRHVLAKVESFEMFHGGTFGPEQGVLAPVAYVLGILLAVWIYGMDGLYDWKEKMLISVQRTM